MKKLVVSLVCVLCSVFGVVNAQESERVNLSGNVTFLSMTNSTLTGGYFSDNPALRASVSASYSDFSFSVMRNSDLKDSKSGANLFAISPSWNKDFGRYNVSATLEFDFFDHQTQDNLVAPYVYITRTGGVNIEVMVAYGWCFHGGTFNSEMLAISKSYKGYTFKGYLWNVTWGVNKQNAALEISKNLSDHFKVSVYGHVNDLSREVKSFGAVRVGYSF